MIRVLSACTAPLYVVDEQRKIVFCNSACAQWADVAAEDLIGARCVYHSDNPPGSVAEIASGLCPPPQAMAGQRTHATVSIRVAEGELRQRRAEFLPLGPDSADCPGVLAMVAPHELTEAAPTAATIDEVDAPELHRRVRKYRQRAIVQCQSRELAGESPAMQRVREQVDLAASGAVRVLILGPQGSGHEHVARTIHYLRAKELSGPLTPLSCSLLDAELLQTTITAFLSQCAELKTEEPGALLLLDVDELSKDSQIVLADVANIAEFNVQTLATARRDLHALASEGRFRPELALHLSTLTIELPPLADRPEDIPLLAQMVLEQANAAGKRQLGGFTPDAMEHLVDYRWPGNSRELAEVVQDVHRRASGSLAALDELPLKLRRSARDAVPPKPSDAPVELDRFLEEVEAELIKRALNQARGNKAKAARLLGISRARLLRRAARLTGS